MAFFGRETEADLERIERVKQWTQLRTPYGLFGLPLGVLSVLDACTGVLGLALGIAAVSCGIVGLRDLRRQPELIGHRLCYAAITLGSLGMVAGASIWTYFRFFHGG